MSRLVSNAPASQGSAITKGTAFPLSRGIWVGTGGSLIVTWPDGSTATLLNVASGTLMPLAVTNIDAGSTASDLVRLA
jgi:hypothetical protein